MIGVSNLDQRPNPLAQRQPVQIRDAVFATRDFDGVLGKWSFTDTGDTTLTGMSGRQVKNGKWDDDSTVALQAPQ